MAELAIEGGKPVRTKPFPEWPMYDECEERALLEVLRSRKWWYGERVREFEEKFASYQDARFGITTTSGTTALQIALTAAGVGAGDEVIVPPYTFVATATAVLAVNAIPVFADVARDTLNLDPEAVREAITEKTKAIIPVHFAGYPADMDELEGIAQEHGLVIIEDACHAWGTDYKGRKVGAIGSMGAFSFQASKNITSSEGGIILTDDEELADLCRSYSNCGRGKDRPWYEHYILGGNYRMTEFQAAILLCQLGRLDDQVTRRMESAKVLDEGLREVEGIELLQQEPKGKRRSYHLYCFRYVQEDFGGVPREKFIEALVAEGIPASPGYPFPLYRNPLFERRGEGPRYCPLSCPYYGKEVDYTKVHCPNTEQVCREVVWLPQTVLLGSKEDMEDVIRAVRKVREHVGELRD
ncbi:MAG: DegT/DnrJ/EryC1/StrS family aminotransferase [Candidatus Latescibacterota bacterium]|nr:MAG: DegT/DnrJ/EryC1/StrS family aminotransferase [Candidatus Latescibacterota bacterium]